MVLICVFHSSFDGFWELNLLICFGLLGCYTTTSSFPHLGRYGRGCDGSADELRVITPLSPLVIG